MEQIPIPPGDLHEFTIEIETRPMVSLEPEVLNELQANAEPEMGDPVFGLDESKGSVFAVFQVWAVTAALAASLGAWMFFTTMVRSGVDLTKDTIEMIVVTKASEHKIGDLEVVLPKEEART